MLCRSFSCAPVLTTLPITQVPVREWGILKGVKTTFRLRRWKHHCGEEILRNSKLLFPESKFNFMLSLPTRDNFGASFCLCAERRLNGASFDLPGCSFALREKHFGRKSSTTPNGGGEKKKRHPYQGLLLYWWCIAGLGDSREKLLENNQWSFYRIKIVCAYATELDNLFGRCTYSKLTVRVFEIWCSIIQRRKDQTCHTDLS